MRKPVVEDIMAIAELRMGEVGICAAVTVQDWLGMKHALQLTAGNCCAGSHGTGKGRQGSIQGRCF